MLKALVFCNAAGCLTTPCWANLLSQSDRPPLNGGYVSRRFCETHYGSGCAPEGGRFVALLVALSFLIMEQESVAQSPAPATQGAPAAPVDTSPATLDHLLAPIALYPDPLLMQVLAASVNSQEVLDGGNWLLENKTLEETALDDAAQKAGFGAAMTALFHFPDVVDQMCTHWTGRRRLATPLARTRLGCSLRCSGCERRLSSMER